MVSEQRRRHLIEPGAQLRQHAHTYLVRIYLAIQQPGSRLAILKYLCEQVVEVDYVNAPFDHLCAKIVVVDLRLLDPQDVIEQ